MHPKYLVLIKTLKNDPKCFEWLDKHDSLSISALFSIPAKIVYHEVASRSTSWIIWLVTPHVTNWEPILTSFSNFTAWQSRGSKGLHAVNAIEGLGWKFDYSNPNREEQIKGKLRKCVGPI